jgi:hypothetical protein|tara:strand:+ start:61 stop:426 length:366 start_codon:yes stop_codon:yes gene_type:complete
MPELQKYLYLPGYGGNEAIGEMQIQPIRDALEGIATIDVLQGWYKLDPTIEQDMVTFDDARLAQECRDGFELRGYFRLKKEAGSAAGENYAKSYKKGLFLVQRAQHTCSGVLRQRMEKLIT